MRLLSAALLCFTLAACAGTKPAQIELASCDTYAATLSELATLKAAGKLSVTQIGYVDAARPGLNAICQSPPPDISATALNTALDAGVKALASVVIQVEGK